MSKARLVLTALFLEHQTPAQVAARYGVHRKDPRRSWRARRWLRSGIRARAPITPWNHRRRQESQRRRRPGGNQRDVRCAHLHDVRAGPLRHRKLRRRCDDLVLGSEHVPRMNRLPSRDSGGLIAGAGRNWTLGRGRRQGLRLRSPARTSSRRPMASGRHRRHQQAHLTPDLDASLFAEPGLRGTKRPALWREGSVSDPRRLPDA